MALHSRWWLFCNGFLLSSEKRNLKISSWLQKVWRHDVLTVLFRLAFCNRIRHHHLSRICQYQCVADSLRLLCYFGTLPEVQWLHRGSQGGRWEVTRLSPDSTDSMFGGEKNVHHIAQAPHFTTDRIVEWVIFWDVAMHCNRSKWPKNQMYRFQLDRWWNHRMAEVAPYSSCLESNCWRWVQGRQKWPGIGAATSLFVAIRWPCEVCCPQISIFGALNISVLA